MDALGSLVHERPVGSVGGRGSVPHDGLLGAGRGEGAQRKASLPGQWAPTVRGCKGLEAPRCE